MGAVKLAATATDTSPAWAENAIAKEAARDNRKRFTTDSLFFIGIARL